LRTCQEDVGSTGVTAETTIVQELGELDRLATAALRFAYTRDAVGGTTAATLSGALKASKRDILKALQELEKLQFIGREPNTNPGRAIYRLTPTGGFYLKACEVRRKQGGATVTAGTQVAK
jgi:DNA-binding HxlR family transcriptional regulator